MASIVMQRDLVVAWKKETISNVNILSKLQCISAELSRLVFKENALEKPTQNLFNHLSYYFLSIIDAKVSASFTWPLYDTKAERAYRKELASFISDYSSKGLLSPVMSSYLVNPSSYKVTQLIFQLSQLAVDRMLLTKMKKDSKKKFYTVMTEKYKSQQKEGFMECIEKETQVMMSTFSNYLIKRKSMERIAELFRKKITEMETKLEETNAHQYICNLVNGFLKYSEVDEESKSELCKLKNVKEHSKIFDIWLVQMDTTIDTMEKTWDDRVASLLQSSQAMYQTTEALIAKNTGQCDSTSYTVEYNQRNNVICTKDLQKQVNSQHMYVLRNIEKDGQLNFPNLIRAFFISICFILKNNDIGDEIYVWNKCIEGVRKHYSEIVSTMRILNERVVIAEAKLESTTMSYNRSLSMREMPELPPLPNLSNLKACRDSNQVIFDTFTPLNSSKYKFNLRRKTSGTIFVKPQPLSSMTPFYTTPREDFLKSIVSCRASTYNHQKREEFNNMSVISHVNRGNETITECSSGFTKQQILKLLSTKKTSSCKKFNTERANINVKEGGLFNVSGASNESNGLFRCYSSPNLFENREKKCYSKGRGRHLSIMQEDSPPSFTEMSGIAILDRDVNHSTPQDLGNAESSRNVIDTSSIPAKLTTSNVLNMELNLDKEMTFDSIVSPILEESRKSVEVVEKSVVRNDTPKTNAKLVKKTSSLEKIINRFKKVRANVIPDKKEDTPEFKTIVEERIKIRSGNCDFFTANRILLPDLLSPNCSNRTIKSSVDTDYLDKISIEIDEVESRKPRQSLGAALGVDETILDQFDLID